MNTPAIKSVATLLISIFLITNFGCDKPSDEDCVEQTWYEDADGDGFGNPAKSQSACEQPSGYVANDDDTNDQCVDSTWYEDADNDGLGNPDVSTEACTAPTGYVANANDDDDTVPASSDPEDVFPDFSDADAVLAAIQIVSYQMVSGNEVTIFTDAASAGFFDPVSSGSFLDAGVIRLNNNELIKGNDNAYVLPDPNNPGQVDLNLSTSSGNMWEVNGSSDVTAFSRTTLKTMPQAIKFDGNYASATAGNDLVVNIESAPNSNRILWFLHVNGQKVRGETTGAVTTYTFTGAETQNLSGSGVLQVVPYNYETNTFGGKKIYFVNERVVSQSITF